MEKTVCRFTILFEDPFWVGVYEREEGGRYEACKMTFGAEPKDYEVYALLLQNWQRLRFSPALKLEKREEHRLNPKRMQRQIAAAVEERGIGTKAQQALKLQHEQGKAAHRAASREVREAEKNRRRELLQQKHREKHRGH